MQKKRLIAVLLIVFMNINICAFARNDTTGEILSQLNIMETVGDGRVISKGAFSHGLVNILGSNFSYAGDSKFEDLEKDSEYFKEISMLTNLGILNGDENKRINADMPITFNQAVKMVMCLLGYEDYAKICGEYPQGYLQAAKKTDVLKGMTEKGESWLEESDAERLLYNALYAPVLNVSAIDKNGNIKYDNKGDDNTPLYVYRGLKNGKGIVTAVPYYEMNDGSTIRDNDLYIDAKRYCYSMPDESLMGKQVEFFYDDNNNIAALAVTDKNEVIEFSFEDIENFSGDTITYYDENGRKNQIVINTDSEVLYNCEPLKSALKFDYENSDGIVKAVSNDGFGGYEYIFINSYSDFLVGSVDRINDVLYDKNDVKNKLDLSSSKGNTVKITDEYGEDVSIDDIENDYLLTVIKGTHTIRICICENEISGNVAEIIDNDKILVNNTEYIGSKYFNNYYSVSVGKGGRFLINNYGKLSAYEEENGRYQFGYLIKAAKQDDVFTTIYKYRILDEKGKILTLDCPDKIEFNGVSGQSAESVYNSVTSGTASGKQLVRFYANSEDELMRLETAVGENDFSGDRLKLASSLSNAVYISSSGIYGGKLVVTGNTLLFGIPNTENNYDEKDYLVTYAKSYLKSSSKYSMKAYIMGDDKCEIDALVIERSYDSTGLSDSAPIAVFDRYYRTVDENGDIVVNMVLYTDSGKNTFTMRHPEQVKKLTDGDGNPYTLKRGDIIRYSYDSISNDLRTFALYYSREQNKLCGNASVNAWNSSFHYDFGYAYKKTGDYVFVCAQQPTPDLTIDDLSLYKVGSLIIYDSNNDKLIKGSAGDINDYLSTERNTRILVYTESSVPKLMYAFYE